MNIRQLPSGNYQIREMIDGKTYTKTLSYKPTKREAAILMKNLYKTDKPENKGTFEYYARKYIESKKNILSPSTIYYYVRQLRYCSDAFKTLKFDDIDSFAVQAEINLYATNHSPKSVYNLYGFISAVLSVFYPNLILNVTLPQKVKNEPYIPSESDIEQLLNESKDSRYELMLYLCCLGLRKSEIMALSEKDYNNGIIHIQTAKVYDGKSYIEKTTKTTLSNRYVACPQYVQELIEKNGLHFDFHVNSFDQWLNRIQKNLNIPHFSPHKMRHYFASKMLTLTDAKTVQELGGWSSDYTMKRIYAHSLVKNNMEKQKELMEKLFK